jgi:hypothetical protein
MKTNTCIRHHWRHPRPRGRTSRPAGKALLQVLKRQHAATLAEFADPNEWRDWMNWLAGLPLTLDLDGLRIVHASWDARQLKKCGLSPRAWCWNALVARGIANTTQSADWSLPNGHLLATADGNATARDSRKMVEVK